MKETYNQKPFIYYENLKTWEIVSMVIYTAITLMVILVYELGNSNSKQITLIGYIVFSQLGLYFALYTSLRNFKSYLIWFGFGIVHIILFLNFEGNPELQMYHGDISSGLINTIVLLLLFQCLRYLSLKMQHREFVAPAKGGPDLFENRKITPADFIVFVIYMASWGALSYLIQIKDFF